MTDLEDKRLIEVDFPLKEVSKESVREKNIRHGHISSLHTWWARRPLAASRATILAALIPAPSGQDELNKKLQLVSEISKWENSSNQRLIGNARKEILDFFERRPKVLDCFAGGGAIPLEALRLGCETYALEYNPVAYLILKATLEYPQKFGKQRAKLEEKFQSASCDLIDDVKKWGNWVLDEVKKEIAQFYPPDSDGNIPVGYLWARTIKCQRPSCKAEIPLMRELWLAKKGNKRIALKMVIDKEKRRIDFEIAEGKLGFDPTQGTTRQATVQCPVCKAAIKAKTTRSLFQNGESGQRLIAVVLRNPREKGKVYRISTQKDLDIFRKSEEHFEQKRSRLVKEWELDPIPSEPLPTPSGGVFGEETDLYLNFRCIQYGHKRWGDLFNSRQKLALVAFMEKTRDLHNTLIENKYDPDYARAVETYLAFALDKLSTGNNVLTRWNVSSESFAGKPDQDPRLSMRWNYGEANPFSNITGSYLNQIKAVTSVIENVDELEPIAEISNRSATDLPYPNDFFDAVFTDPPYYSNYPYADLADFFYVLLKRSMANSCPELFSTPLSPRMREIIENLSLLRGMNKEKALKLDDLKGKIKTKEFFEENLGKAFLEIRRVLKPDGIATIVYAHRSTAGWEALINSLLSSGLVVVASWPIYTERKARLVAQGTAALASSVYMICRKRTEEKSAYFDEIRKEIESRIKQKLTQFWEQGISGADFFVSAIGPAVEVFGRYSKVEKLSGEEVSVQELLEYVRKIVSEFALERVLKRADLGGVDAETRFYLLWRWTFGNAKVHFDDAIKLSRPMGVELTNLWDKGGFVEKEKEFIKVLDPKERAKDPVFLKKTKFTSMIDVLHHVVILWERGEKEKIKEVLNETGYSGNAIFWQTAQAISEVLPQGDKEKQLLQGFLYGKEVYVKEAARGKKTLLDFTESG